MELWIHHGSSFCGPLEGNGGPHFEIVFLEVIVKLHTSYIKELWLLLKRKTLLTWDSPTSDNIIFEGDAADECWVHWWLCGECTLCCQPPWASLFRTSSVNMFISGHQSSLICIFMAILFLTDQCQHLTKGNAPLLTVLVLLGFLLDSVNLHSWCCSSELVSFSMGHLFRQLFTHLHTTTVIMSFASQRGTSFTWI